MPKRISIVFIILMLLLTLIFCIPQNKNYKVIDDRTPSEIFLDKKQIVFNDFECFDTAFTNKNKYYAEKFDISEEEAFVLGNLGKYWAEKNIKNRKIYLKREDLIYENRSKK